MRWEQRKCNRQGVLTLAGIHRYSAVLASGYFDPIQSSDNRQSQSADFGQCAGNRLPNLCSRYTPLGCMPLTLVACGTASTE